MVKSSVPNLPLEPSARHIAEHELTGHAVYRSWCRYCAASNGRAHAHSSRVEGELPGIGVDYGFFGRDGEDVLFILCVKCRNSSTGCLGATVVDRNGCLRLREFVPDCIHQEFGVQENPGEIRH